MIPFLRTLCLLAFASLALPLSALERPEAPVVLTVSGEIAVENALGLAEFDIGMLRDLDWREIETFTPFTEGMQRFAGPTLASLLDRLGITGGTLHALAINDYAVDIPVSDAAEFGVLIAVLHNGQPMRIRDRGPLWLIYPEKVQPKGENLNSAKMIWQLNRIDIRP